MSFFGEELTMVQIANLLGNKTVTCTKPISEQPRVLSSTSDGIHPPIKCNHKGVIMPNKKELTIEVHSDYHGCDKDITFEKTDSALYNTFMDLDIGIGTLVFSRSRTVKLRDWLNEVLADDDN